jgi:hypothetical protein
VKEFYLELGLDEKEVDRQEKSFSQGEKKVKSMSPFHCVELPRALIKTLIHRKPEDTVCQIVDLMSNRCMPFMTEVALAESCSIFYGIFHSNPPSVQMSDQDSCTSFFHFQSDRI